MERIDPAVVSERSIGLGTLPQVAARLFSLLNDPQAALNDVEKLIRPDVGLTANLLRYANSPIHRGVRRITTAKEAVIRLGARQVLEVVLGASFARLIPARLFGYGMTADAFWGHSMAVALLSNRLGREAGFASADLAFTAGLLHDLGKVVLATFMTTGAGLNRGAVERLTGLEVERAQLGTDHTELGEAVAIKWQLPVEVCAVVRWHHEPQKAPTASQRLLTAAIALADGLVKQGIGIEGTTPDVRALVDGIDAAVLAMLGFTAPRLERLLVDSADEIRHARAAWTDAVK